LRAKAEIDVAVAFRQIASERPQYRSEGEA
jgi:hypothetical protein